MSYGLIDVREWDVFVDLTTGEPVDPPGLEIEGLVRGIVGRNPYPGDLALESIDWVTRLALELDRAYQPQFMMLTYANQYFLSRYEGLSPSLWKDTTSRIFAQVDGFVRTTGFIPIVVGLGRMIPLRQYIDLNDLDGLVVAGGGSAHYAGIFAPSERDLTRLGKMPGIEKVVARDDFLREFGGSPDFIRRFPDYLLAAEEGFTFKAYGGMARPMYKIPAKDSRIPVYTPLLGHLVSLTDIKGLIMEAIATNRVALILLEGIGAGDFQLDYRLCSNQANWFTYNHGESHYLAITTGRHLQYNHYPPGYKYYIDDHETRANPYAGPFVDTPSHTIGQELRQRGLKSAAVGNRSVLTHMTSGADIAIECLARGLYNYGTLAAFNVD